MSGNYNRNHISDKTGGFSQEPSVPSSSLHAPDMFPAPNSPTRPSPNDLQLHLYASFLQRKTADVALRISGSWHAIYRLHRVILIQAGFFQSLFTSGFSEAATRISIRKEQEYIDIVFDDPNITRAAFEVCIARLYGGGPTLWIPPSLIPTASHPLTPLFATTRPDDSLDSTASLLPPSLDISTTPTIPLGHHPGTPRFLLSLLSTAVFLSIPTVASQALSAIVRTVGPHTVIRYLNFAIGRGIGSSEDPCTDCNIHHEAAAGLEEVAELVHDEHHSTSYESIAVPTDLRPERRAPSPVTTVSEESCKHCAGPPGSDTELNRDPTEHLAKNWKESIRGKNESHHCEPCYYYGALSDKVGEAAVCWLTRWGFDMLRLEEEAAASPSPTKEGKCRDVPWFSAPKAQREGDRPGSAPPDMPGQRFNGKPGNASGKPDVVPVIWRRGGLAARWIRGILTSDALFVRGEKERYEMAKSVAEMRRAARAEDPGTSGECEDEEGEFDRLFNDGIYYANMHLDDLMSIAKDVSSLTGKPIVPLSVLQAALWTQSTLCHRVSSKSTTLSPTATKELGVSMVPGDVQKSALHPEERTKAFYPIPADSSHRLGDNTGIEGASMDQLFDLGSIQKSSSQATDANFFGLEQTHRPASDFAPTASSSLSSETKWTSHPPFRFSVEFWDVDALKEKSRLHSHTVWYAGSLYNVYVQVVRKKGVQLGIYLHRQSTVDPLPPSSTPATRILPSPSRDKSVLGRGSSSSVSSPRSPLDTSPVSPISPIPSSASMSSLARMTVTAPASPATPSSTTSSIFSSAPSSSTLATSSSTLSTRNSVGVIHGTSATALPVTTTPVVPSQPYRDSRPAIGAYFTIACASATGASLTRFTSAPDTFSVSQSWGWKSSSLRTEECLEYDGEGQSVSGTLPAAREVSLRATVVLGVV